MRTNRRRITDESRKTPSVPPLNTMSAEQLAEEVAFWRQDAWARAERLLALFNDAAAKRGKKAAKAMARLEFGEIAPLIAVVRDIRGGRSEMFRSCEACGELIYPGDVAQVVKYQDETIYRCFQHRYLEVGGIERERGNSYDLDVAIDKLMTARQQRDDKEEEAAAEPVSDEALADTTATAIYNLDRILTPKPPATDDDGA